VLPSGRNTTSTVFSPGASTVAVPADCTFSSAILYPAFLAAHSQPRRTLRITKEFRLRYRMRGFRPFANIGRVHGLAFEGGGNRAIHHQFGQSHGGLVQSINPFADPLIVFALRALLQHSLEFGNALFLLIS